MTQTLLRISTRVLSMVRPTMAKGDIRYYLNGIRIESLPAGGVVAVATDGHRLAACVDPAGECAHPMIVALPPDGWARCDKPGRAIDDGQRKLVVTFDDRAYPVDDFGNLIGRSSFAAYETSIEGEMAGWPHTVWRAPENAACYIEGQFPNWRAILPKTPEAWAALLPCTASLAVGYVSQLQAHVRRPSPRSECVRFWQAPAKPNQDPDSGAVFAQFEAYPELVVVIMPMWGDVKQFPFPAFMVPAP